MSEAQSPSPRIQIDDANPRNTADMREHPVFTTADPEGEVPDVELRTGTPNPYDRPRSIATRVGIHTEDGEIGAYNLVQTGDRSWMNDVKIDEAHRGKKYAVAAYLGTIVALHEEGRVLQSDLAGLSEHSDRVWQSLTKRGLAQTTGEVDQHGFNRYVSTPPTKTE